ncbi:hypothetical protein KUA24_116 [Vibrio phage HNL01]|nr:hypothetical protein KUA24_116 [Vibrio phage HNL01]
MIYLASLYSNGASSDSLQHQQVRQQRYEYTLKRLTRMLCDGSLVYSPIAHCHEASNLYGLPKEYEFWQRIDRHMIDLAEEVRVLTMEDDFGHWVTSAGVTDEITYAKSLGKEVVYCTCDDYKLEGI